MKQIEPPALVTYARMMLDSGKVADADKFQRLTNAEGKKFIENTYSAMFCSNFPNQ